MTTDYQYNNRGKKDLRKKLRNEAPQAERILWGKIQGSQLSNLKFRRQYGVGSFVIDFYCPKLRLAIEVDGDSHYKDGAEVYDKKRQKYIEEHNIHFLRFTNDDIYNNLDGVLEMIAELAGGRRSPLE